MSASTWLFRFESWLENMGAESAFRKFHHEIRNQWWYEAFTRQGSLACRIRAFLMTAHDTAAYRASAKACADLALEIPDPNTKLLLLTLAESWLRLADYVDSRGLDGTTRPSEASEAGVVHPSQQQQQLQIDSEQDDPEG